MLIEQIIEFEFREPGPPGCTCMHSYNRLFSLQNKNYVGIYLPVDYFIVY